MPVYKLEGSELVVIAESLGELISTEFKENNPGILDPAYFYDCIEALGFKGENFNDGGAGYAIYARRRDGLPGNPAELPWARYLIDVNTPDRDYVYILVSAHLNDFLKVIRMVEPYEGYRKRVNEARDEEDFFHPK